MIEQNLEGKQEIIEDILKELPADSSIVVELPSENRAYTLPDPAAPITLRPMNFEDEKAIVSAKKGQDPTNMVLARCVGNLNIQEILAMDKLYLLMKLREISYGDDYKTMLICQHCHAENQTTIRLSELNVNPVPDDFTDVVEVFLPGIKKEAKVRRPRVKDDRFVTEDIYDHLWRFVPEIAGHTDKSIIAAVIARLPIADTKVIMKAMRTDYGLDTRIKFECKECGEVSVVDLPIDSNFFDVN